MDWQAQSVFSRPFKVSLHSLICENDKNIFRKAVKIAQDPRRVRL